MIAAGGEQVTYINFLQYSLTRNLPEEFPGARGFGFIRPVKPEDVPAFQERERAEGQRQFEVMQLGPNDGVRYVIEYVEPRQSNREATGLDIASEPVRKTAADMAVTIGNTAMTAPIRLVQVEPEKSELAMGLSFLGLEEASRRFISEYVDAELVKQFGAAVLDAGTIRD